MAFVLTISAAQDHNMKLLFKFRYPKLAILLLCFFVSFYIFSNPLVKNKIQLADNYLGMFIAGIFFSFGFTAPFSVGYFLTLDPQNIFIAAFIGGLGALLSDLLIFKIIKLSFIDEFNRLKKTKAIKEINYLLSQKPLARFKNYMLFALAGFIIASPLPDELGASMLAGLTKIKTHVLAIISFIMNTLGIFILLSI